MNPPIIAVDLREREAQTVAALRSIDEHLQRLNQAKAQRTAGLARIRAEIALCTGPSASENDDD
jgi:hypothetical protein